MLHEHDARPRSFEIGLLNWTSEFLVTALKTSPLEIRKPSTLRDLHSTIEVISMAALTIGSARTGMMELASHQGG
jgi:hypothetical protein